METWDFVHIMENTLERVRQSRVVMEVAMEYFESTDEESRRMLSYYADKIYSLLCSADTLLYYECKNLEESVQKAEEDVENERNAGL